MPVMEGIWLQEEEIRRGVFLQAFASPERIEGKCRLVLVFKKLIPCRELELHSLTLAFNHEGVKEYAVRTCPMTQRRNLTKTLSVGYVELSLQEAAALVQDAYRQNLVFRTRPAERFTPGFPLLKFDTGGLEVTDLVKRLCLRKISPEKFVKAYLSAMRRLDSGLIYDLSAPERQKALGSRADFFLREREERHYTYYSSKVIEVREQAGVVRAAACVVASAGDEALFRITYGIILVKSESGWLVRDFFEEERDMLPAGDPDDPKNEEVFYSVYQLKEDNGRLSRWLEREADIILAGESEGGQYYKWLKTLDFPCSDFNSSASTFAEVYLSLREAVIFARKAGNLMLAEKAIGEQLGDQFAFRFKGYLPKRELELKWKSGGRAAVALLELDQPENDRNNIHDTIHEVLAGTAECVECLGSQDRYFFFRDRGPAQQGAVEVYLMGRWIKINAFRGDVEEAVQWLKQTVCVKEVIYQDELEIEAEHACGRLHPTDMRAWRVMGCVRRFNRAAEKLKNPALQIRR